MKKILYVMVAIAIGVAIFQFGVSHGQKNAETEMVINQQTKLDEPHQNAESIALETEATEMASDQQLLNIIYICVGLIIALIGCVILAKKNQLLFLHGMKETEQPTYTGQGVREQYE